MVHSVSILTYMFNCRKLNVRNKCISVDQYRIWVGLFAVSLVARWLIVIGAGTWYWKGIRGQWLLNSPALNRQSGTCWTHSSYSMIYWAPNFAHEHESNMCLAACPHASSMSGGGWCVWSQSIVSTGVVQAHVYSIYSVYRHTQIQMQILEVTQRSDRVGRDLIKNGEASVIKYHLNPPTSCDPAISQTPATATYTINNAV